MTTLLLLATLACRNDKDVPIDTGPVDTQPAMVDLDQDGFGAEEDCDDDDPAVNPDAEELCNGIDDDCDGVADEDDAVDAQTWYVDADDDGYGDDLDPTIACEPPSGHSDVGGDCDDDDPEYNPGALEDDCADPNDYNCDGSVGYADEDADGWAACEECNDADPAIHPDAAEVCDEIDNDCDALIDDEDDSLDTSTAGTWYADTDGDSFGDPAADTLACDPPAEHVANSADCDDTEGAINPDATEVCDGVDNDCDALIDDEDDSLDTSTADTWYADTDGDGEGDSSVTALACEEPTGHAGNADDCDDSDGAINTSATEVCDEIDNDCDGAIDDDDDSLDSSTADTWYADTDGDGEGDPDVSSLACDQPSGTEANADDCDDADEDINTSATEVCDEIDNDCDGAIDDDDDSLDTSTAETWYADTDGDGEGDSSVTTLACEEPSGHADNDDDCDDSDGAVNTSASESCNAVDDDCDGDVDEGVLGTGADCPATDCAEILADNPSATDATYTLDDGDYECDMSTDGGGWTLVGDDIAVWGTSYDTAYYNSEGFTFDEVLVEWVSGSAHAHCTYPESLTGCNNLGLQFASEDWGVMLNYGSSVCGMALTSYESATSYIGGYEFTVGRTSSTDTLRVGTLEGIAACTTSDNPGTAYLDLWVRN